MKVNRKKAVAFLVALGFTKATGWDDAKIKERLVEAPTKLAEEDVPEGHEDFYKSIAGAKGDFELADDGEAKPEKKEKKETKPEAKPAKAEKDSKPAKKPEAKPEKKDAKPEAKKPAAKPTKKPAAPAKEKVDRDQYGCAAGTISHKVNSVVSSEWMTEEEIAKAAEVTLDQARGRLYYGAEEEQFERRRLIQYRIKPKAKTDKDSKK